MIVDRTAQLETFPGLGRPGGRQGTRELVCPPYIIVYRVKEDVAEILYIWHGAQDWR
jgi:plasmid stabilization system protein ParE